MNEYDWSQFHVRMYYLAPIREVFRRFSTQAGLESFYIYRAEHLALDGSRRSPQEVVKAGDRYDWTYVHKFRHGGEFEAVEQDRYLRFTFGEMTVAISFRQVGEATEVDLHQTNCAIDDPDRAWQHLNCRSCWIYFLTNLRSVLACGQDVRDFEHPNWNDSVSISFDVDGDPGMPRPKIRSIA